MTTISGPNLANLDTGSNSLENGGIEKEVIHEKIDFEQLYVVLQAFVSLASN